MTASGPRVSALPLPLQQVSATCLHGDTASTSLEWLAEESPVAIVYNGFPHVVMMATPQDLDDFAYGFTLAEGIADRVEEIEIVDCLRTDNGISLQLLIPQRRFDALDSRQRNLTGRTGCGLCGAASLEAAIRPVRQVHTAADLKPDALRQAFARLQAAQPLNDACGGLHAAAALGAEGELLVREDAGRHNAVDKVIGACARQRLSAQALLVTSRASYEVVHKAAQAGIPLVAVISAPTALAVRIAREAGVTLVGFVREQRMTVYARGASSVGSAIDGPPGGPAGA